MERRRATNDRPSGEPLVDDFWLTTSMGSVLATQFWPAGPLAPESVGVVLVPGIAHEYQTMQFGLVALARDLAAAGMPALLIDLAGTAQGSGGLDTPDVAHQWGDDVRCAVDHVRRSGVQNVAVIGTRLGALIALDALASEPVDLMVLWAPVLSGKRYVRELKMMQAAAADRGAVDLPGLTVAGYNLPPDLLDRVRKLEAGTIDGKPASRLCVIDSAERLTSIDTSLPLFTEVPVEQVVAIDTDEWLFSAADGNTSPFVDGSVVVARIRDTIAAQCLAPSPAAPASSLPPTAQRPDVDEYRTQVFTHDGVPIRETLVRVGKLGLSGIISGPATLAAEAPDNEPASVLITTLGPGRLFVDLARQEAARGRTCLRFDLSGFGSSPRHPRGAWADFYHPSAQQEIAEAIDHMISLGYEQVDLIGFCAGAWSAVQMRPHPAVRRIVGINLQLFIRRRLLHRRPWPDLPPTQRLLAGVAQRPQVRRVVKKIQFVHPLPSPTLRWIRRQRRAGVDVTLIFADDDRGYEYYRDKIDNDIWRPAQRSSPTIRSYHGLGHLPSGSVRTRMLDEIHSLS